MAQHFIQLECLYDVGHGDVVANVGRAKLVEVIGPPSREINGGGIPPSEVGGKFLSGKVDKSLLKGSLCAAMVEEEGLFFMAQLVDIPG